LSDDLSAEDNGAYVIPWGRLHPGPRLDILDGLKTIEDGGTGQASKFWEWCENQTADHRI
jgi:hypothetical protein